MSSKMTKREHSAAAEAYAAAATKSSGHAQRIMSLLAVYHLEVAHSLGYSVGPKEGGKQ